MATITADLTGGYAVELRAGDHLWHADEPVDLGGTDTGPSPYEMLVGALGACTCITVSMYCRRKGWDLHSISARYEIDKIHADDCESCEDEHEGLVDRIRCEVFIEGTFDAAQRERLATVVERCPVHKTLGNGVHFTDAVVFVG